MLASVGMIFEPSFFCARTEVLLLTVQGASVFIPTLDHDRTIELPRTTMRGWTKSVASDGIPAGGMGVAESVEAVPRRAFKSCCAMDDCSTGVEGCKIESGCDASTG